MNDELLADLLAAVEQQLVAPQTKYVAKTFDRLVKLGLKDAEAKEQIAICLGEEMDNVMRTKKAFDEKAYKAALDELPYAEEESESDEEGVAED